MSGHTRNFSDGLAEWIEGDTCYISVAFTWKLNLAYDHAVWAKALGQTVKIGGPALFLNQMKHQVFEIADQVGGDYPEAVLKHNPEATFASRGCPVGCWFCIVPAMEGKEFTLIPEFIPRPILCDNNLSGLPIDYQAYIVAQYQGMGVKLRDANSGFEPRTFTKEVYDLWRPLVDEGGGPWRFAYDDMDERDEALAVMKMLKDVRGKRKQVYTLIGNEPFDACMFRIQEVIDNGCEPYAQPLMKLNALDKKPWVRFDWTERQLLDVARWVNRYLYKYSTFEEYRGPIKTKHIALEQGSLL